MSVERDDLPIFNPEKCDRCQYQPPHCSDSPTWWTKPDGTLGVSAEPNYWQGGALWGISYFHKWRKVIRPLKGDHVVIRSATPKAMAKHISACALGVIIGAADSLHAPVLITSSPHDHLQPGQIYMVDRYSMCKLVNISAMYDSYAQTLLVGKTPEMAEAQSDAFRRLLFIPHRLPRVGPIRRPKVAIPPPSRLLTPVLSDTEE